MLLALIPVAGVVTQTPNPGHHAVDIACRRGAPVRAMTTGAGRFSWNGRMGWTFIQDGPEGRFSMSHLAEGGPSRHYERGEVVAACGNTGTWSTGPHVHIEAPDVILHQLYKL